MLVRPLLVTLLGAFAAVPVHSYDTNALGRHLEHQQSVRVQNHQNRMKDPNYRKARQQQALPRCTEDFVPRAEYRSMETQYRQKVVAEGKQSADRWSKQQASAWHRRLQQQGVCR